MAKLYQTTLFIIIGALFVCSGGVYGHPTMPTGFTAQVNTTAALSNGSGFQVLQTMYQGFNSTLTVTHYPTSLPYQLQDGDDDTAVQYNPATKTCTATCMGGTVCPNGKCGVYGGGLFGPLPLAQPNGACSFPINGAMKFTLSAPQGNGKTLDIEYCFVSNTPIYVLEKITSSSTNTVVDQGRNMAEWPLGSVTRSLTAQLDAFGAADASIDEVLVLVKSLTPITPHADTFDIPPWCQCS